MRWVSGSPPGRAIRAGAEPMRAPRAMRPPRNVPVLSVYIRTCLGRARLAELEERMSFLNGLEKSLVELGREPEERMLDYLNSPLSAANRHPGDSEDAAEFDGNPRSPLRSPKDAPKSPAVMLPNAVDAGSEEEEEEDDHDARRNLSVQWKRPEEPLAGHELFVRKKSTFAEDKNSKVNDLSVGDLRGIIRQEVVEKAIEVGMIGAHQKEPAPESESSSIEGHGQAMNNPHLSAPRDRLPRTMEEAVPISLPLAYGGFSRKSPIRNKCMMITKDKSWNIAFLLFLIANCVYIAIVPDDPSLKEGLGNIFDWVCNILYLFEILCNIVAYGFMDHNGWFSVSTFNKIDFFILLATLIEEVAATQGIVGLSLKPFRSEDCLLYCLLLRTPPVLCSI